MHAEFINGCCYGRLSPAASNKGDYRKIAGQEFWELISGSPSLYTDIIEPLGHQALERNEDVIKAYNAIVFKLTKEFFRDYCDEEGNIFWKKIVGENSGRYTKPERAKKSS